MQLSEYKVYFSCIGGHELTLVTLAKSKQAAIADCISMAKRMQYNWKYTKAEKTVDKVF